LKTVLEVRKEDTVNEVKLAGEIRKDEISVKKRS
jgi:hypothetical protein